MRLALAIACCIATPAFAQTPEPAPPTSQPTAVKKVDKVKCRMEAPVGSLVPKRVCTTERVENLNRDEARATFVRPQHMEPR